MKFLIIQTAFIGDVVLATSLIEKLKVTFPDSTIDFLLRKGNESLFVNHPYLNQLIIFDKKEKKHKSILKSIRKIRSEKYDYVVNVQRFFTTGLLTAFSGAKEKIGFKKNPLSFLFTKKINHSIDKKGTHEVERNLSLIAHLTHDKTVSKPKLYPSSKDFDTLPSYPYVCIAPSSVWFTKQLPKEKWVKLIKDIPSKYKVFLLGGKEDVLLCEEIKTNTSSDRVVNYAGKLSFLASAALMSKANMNYTNDSAPLHFASAMNAPITAIFCSTVPYFGFGPLSDESHIVETKKELSCRPCGLHGKKKCPMEHFDCSKVELKYK